MDLTYLIPLLFPLVFIPFWVGISFLLAHLGGWTRLAQTYATQTNFTGQKWGFQGGRMGITNYKGCLTIGTNEQGLYLAVMPLFRVGHPPLFIPWYDITTTQQRGFVISYVEITFARAPSVKLKLWGKWRDRLVAARPDVF